MRRVAFVSLSLWTVLVLVTSCVQRPPEVAPPAGPGHDHGRDDAYWAELAKDYPAFEVDPGGLLVAEPEDRDLYGEWGPVIAWPFVPVSAANLPDGRILAWASNRRSSFPTGNEFTHAATYDPATGAFDEIPLTQHDAFCAHTVMLPDGRVMANGGRNHVATTSIFDYRTDSWTEVASMNRGRWYPTSVTLPDGSVFTAIGSSGGQYPELWTEGEGWDLLTGIDFQEPILDYLGHYEQNWWPLLTVAPDGSIFHSGPTPVMHTIDPSGNGSITPVGPEIEDWYPKHGTTVLYDEGLLLVAGGAIAGNDLDSTDLAMIIDINGGNPDVTAVAPMHHERKFQNGVMLPNGEVLVVGGNGGVKFSDADSVLTPEIWNPETRAWRELADMAVPRNYHSIALLLTDGRVLSAGGGLCNCAADHWDGQIYTPPYLFADDGSPAPRPEIASAPDTVGVGRTFAVEASAGIEAFSLIKMSSTTHAVNTDLRYLPVGFVEDAPGSYQLTSHVSENVLTPGYYMLFALDADGVPSVAEVVQVVVSGPPVVTDPGDQNGAQGADVSLTIEATDPDDDPLSYAASGLPTGLTIDRDSGEISGTLEAAGTFDVTVTVDDGGGVVQVAFRWSVFTPDEQSGVSYAYYQGFWEVLPDFDALTPIETGTVPTFGIEERNRSFAYGFRFTGRVRLETAGDYTFYSRSDDGSRLWIDGVEIVSNDGRHSARERSGTVSLSGGDHEIVVEYFERNGGEVLTVSYSGPGIAKQEIPATALFLPRAFLLRNPGDQQGFEGDAVALPLELDSEVGGATFDATGLPAGLAIDAASGLISGVLAVGSSGSHSVTVHAQGDGVSDSVSFTWSVDPAPPLAIAPIAAPPQQVGVPIDYLADVRGGSAPQVRWLFGDGTAETDPSADHGASHAFASPGRYVVTVTASDESVASASYQFVQAVYDVPTANRPTHTTGLIYQQRSGGDRLWVVNPDQDTVSVFDVASSTRIAEIPVGAGPRTLAAAPTGEVWVASKHDATLSVIDPDALSVVDTIDLPARSQPYGVAFAPGGGSAYVTLEALGQLLRLDPASGVETGSVDVGPDPRHLSIDGDGATLYVSRFITPPVPGESGRSPDVWAGGGEVVVLSSALAVIDTVTLAHSDLQDSEHSGRGLPNYLGPAVIAPDGLSAWVPSKQDNVLRGVWRDGRNLTHDSTVRSISSRIDLASGSEALTDRLDHDDGGVASAALFGRFGSYLFVALEGSREVAVIDPYGNAELARIDVGRAPQALALSPDGRTLYVHNFMDRTVGAFDISTILDGGVGPVAAVATMESVGIERLAPEVLIGKRLFYDALDPRLALQSYISCASCHNDGGHDGRVWDLSGFGEGLRNTIDLRGRAGMGHGPLHWSANFDEVQDFEGQIRDLSGGGGLMSNADFHAGTRDQPLGDPKVGFSADLDALAAYVASLDSVAPSPLRSPSGALTSDGLAGRAVFDGLECAVCHGGDAFSDSGLAGLHDVGTITVGSGERLDGPLLGIDTPTLRGVWTSAPYLHDGSAPDLASAIVAHSGVSVAGSDLDRLVAYLMQIDGDEPGPAFPGGPPEPPGLAYDYYQGFWEVLPDFDALTPIESGTVPTFGIEERNRSFSYGFRFTGRIRLPNSGSYTFYTYSDDGSRLLIDGVEVVSNDGRHNPRERSGTVSLSGGDHEIVVEYFERNGGEVLMVSYSGPGIAKQEIPASVLYLPGEILLRQPGQGQASASR